MPEYSQTTPDCHTSFYSSPTKTRYPIPLGPNTGYYLSTEQQAAKFYVTKKLKSGNEDKDSTKPP